jgi:hypothetical protein
LAGRHHAGTVTAINYSRLIVIYQQFSAAQRNDAIFLQGIQSMQVMVLIFIALILAGYNTTIAEFVQLVGLVQVIFFLPICFLAGLRGYPPGYIVCVASVSWIVSISPAFTQSRHS